MIPFARVLKYGNVVAPPGAADVYSAAFAQFLFDADANKLYGIGTGDSIGLNNSTAYNQWTLCASDVKRVLSNIAGGANFLLYESLDGRIFGCGNPNSIYSGGTGMGTVTVWTDFTSAFNNVTISDIKDVQCYYDYKTNVIMNNGDLWCMGLNDATKMTSFGNGNNTSSPGSLVKVLSGVKKAAGNYYLMQDGSLYCTGTNAKYQYGNSSTNGGAGLTKVVNSGVVDIASGFSCGYYINDAGELYVTGSVLNHGLGNEMGTGANYVNPSWTKLASNVINMAVSIGTISLHYGLSTGDIYFTGYSLNGSAGTGGTASNTTTPMICSPNIGWNAQCKFSRTNANMVYATPNGLYWSGGFYGSGAGQSNSIIELNGI